MLRIEAEQSHRLDVMRELGCLQGTIGIFGSNYGKLGQQS